MQNEMLRDGSTFHSEWAEKDRCREQQHVEKKLRENLSKERARGGGGTPRQEGLGPGRKLLKASHVGAIPQGLIAWTWDSCPETE